MKRLIRKAANDGYWIRFEKDKVVLSKNVGEKLNIDRDPRTEDNTVIITIQAGETSQGMVRRTRDGEKGFYLENYGDDYAVIDGADQIISDATDESGYYYDNNYMLNYDETLKQFSFSPAKVPQEKSRVDIEKITNGRPNDIDIKKELDRKSHKKNGTFLKFSQDNGFVGVVNHQANLFGQFPEGSALIWSPSNDTLYSVTSDGSDYIEDAQSHASVYNVHGNRIPERSQLFEISIMNNEWLVRDSGSNYDSYSRPEIREALNGLITQMKKLGHTPRAIKYYSIEDVSQEEVEGDNKFDWGKQIWP